MPNALHPRLGLLGGFVFDGDVDGVQVYHFLEANDHNVGCVLAVGSPAVAEP